MHSNLSKKKKNSMKSLNFIFVEKINQQCPLSSTSLADVKKKRKTTKYPKVPKTTLNIV